ncbi:hypothetical protein ACQPX6_03045 [Actinomycetospora sp. CA-101289]|uniref:hypothetical protein n=1 Tax=Actinomycetospora sp. CA-101289 TaxID=3239893 RepID=UPI003D99AB87
MATTFTSQPFELAVGEDVVRADIEFQGIDHSETSYEGRVFLNNPDATEGTPTTEDEGYAGSFHIFGHGGCYGDDHGHCEVVPRRPFDPRPEHPLARAGKTVIATEALRRVAAPGSTVRITVVPVITGLTERCTTTDVFDAQSIEVRLYAGDAGAEAG